MSRRIRQSLNTAAEAAPFVALLLPNKQNFVEAAGVPFKRGYKNMY
jgi:hypothetical protein